MRCKFGRLPKLIYQNFKRSIKSQKFWFYNIYKLVGLYFNEKYYVHNIFTINSNDWIL